MNLHLLRDETCQEHEATEALLPLTSPDLDRDEYARILVCFSRVVEVWESWAAVHAPAHLTAMVTDRRRAPLLWRDLEFLGLAPDRDASEAEIEGVDNLLEQAAGAVERDAVFLGAMYVMEGSTLGGQYIARHVEGRFGFRPGEGDAYFYGYGEETGARWNAFREVLRTLPDESTPLAIHAAKAMFAYVQEGMHGCARPRVALDPATPKQVRPTP